MFKYGDKIIKTFRDGTFLSEHLKKSDAAAYDYLLKDVNSLIQKIESCSEKNNLSLLEDLFESSSPADYSKMLINTKKPDKNKKFVAEIKGRISDLKDIIIKMNETEKINKNADETLETIKEILYYNKNAQKSFLLASKVNKGKSEPKLEKSTAERVKLKNRKIEEIEKEEKNINKELFKKYFTDYQSPSDMYKKLRERESKKNEDQVYLIKKVFNRMKKTIEKVPEDRKSMTEENRKIINIVESILYFNQLEQKGEVLKILTPNQIFSRLPITLPQLKAGNNSGKLKDEIRQLLYSLHISKKLTKQLYKSLTDII